MTEDPLPTANHLNMLLEMKKRGVVKDFTEGADIHLERDARSIYCGFDPTADSLQLGNLIPIIALKKFQELGHQPIIVIGGGTGLIGDPSGKTAERAMADPRLVEERAKRFEVQFRRFLDFDHKEKPALLLDNASWLRNVNVVDFMWEVGKRLSAKRIAGLESVKERWEKGDQGISLAEFVYTALQAYDFVHLLRNHNCTIQCGGSDQYGNIVLGVQLARQSIEGAQVFGVTFPLLVDASGVKLGKTADKGTLWLDKDLTSPFTLYQYFLSLSDDDASAWLPYLTLLSDEEIEATKAQQMSSPEGRAAHRRLGSSVVGFVHGHEESVKVESLTKVLFGKNLESVPIEYLHDLAGEKSVSINLRKETHLIDALVDEKLASSKRQAREFLSSGGIYWNGQKVTEDCPIGSLPTTAEKYAILKRGARQIRFVVIS